MKRDDALVPGTSFTWEELGVVCQLTPAQVRHMRADFEAGQRRLADLRRLKLN